MPGAGAEAVRRRCGGGGGKSAGAGAGAGAGAPASARMVVSNVLTSASMLKRKSRETKRRARPYSFSSPISHRLSRLSRIERPMPPGTQSAPV